jgi:rod shape determining protein RodA
MTFTNMVRNRLTPKENARGILHALHIDTTLLIMVIMLVMYGLLILFSASGKDSSIVEQQTIRAGLSLLLMFVLAQISPITYQRWAPWLYAIGVVLLLFVLIGGHINKGAQRWINLGIIRFQPSEMMKLVVPMYLAAHFHKVHLPLLLRSILFTAVIIFLPAILTAKQPDLGTAILIIAAGGSVLLLAGISWRFIASISALGALFAPILWYVMHDYQRQRVLTFLNPERDPLGNGYHIIQSKIAIGSGGLFGKGWLNGTQSHLHFLPEHATDFIFAVCGEEFGFVGSVILILLFMAIIMRGMYITVNAQDTFTRLLAGGITLTFFFSFFINMGMVTGILPVVGLPLPLVSYGGSSMVTIMAGFGILMSIQTHRKLLTT